MTSSTPRRTSWEAATETATLERTPGAVADAERVYRHELGRDAQWRLVEELVVTRAAELCRAYERVVDVSMGLGASADSVSARRVPSVVLTVADRRSPGAADAALPDHLFAFWTVNGERRLCAVPTTVDEASPYARVDAQSGRRNVTVEGDGKATLGVVTCAIRRRFPNNAGLFRDELYFISCRHVLSPTLKRPRPSVRWDLPVRIVEDGGKGAVLGRTSEYAGPLLSGPGNSFDAQLARVRTDEETAALASALGSLDLDDFARTLEEIPDVYYIQTPSGPFRAVWSNLVFDRRIDYSEFADNVVHEQLLTSKADTFGGESGSPVTSERDGGRLLGMHVAGGGGIAYMIPAWALLSPIQYLRSSSEEWTLVDEASLRQPTRSAGSAAGTAAPRRPTLVASRWETALRNARTTGASRLTASQDRLPAGGVTASERMAETDREQLERVAGLSRRLVASAARVGLPPALLAGVASRESRMGRLLAADGTGDRGRAYGLMQVDSRHHEVARGTGPYSAPHLDQAARILADGLRDVQMKHRGWSDSNIIKGASVAFNSGLSNVRTIAEMDRGTTNDDYGADVIARAKYYLRAGAFSSIPSRASDGSVATPPADGAAESRTVQPASGATPVDPALLTIQLERQIQFAKIEFRSEHTDQLRRELLRQDPARQVTSRLQSLVLALSEIVRSKLVVTSLVRDSGHHGEGRAVDLGNEGIAEELLPVIAHPARIESLFIDELIFDARRAGESDPNRWNFDRGQAHQYDESTLGDHRDHIHISVKAET